jgi:hypothetical protein
MPILDQCSMFMMFPFWMAGMPGSGLMLGGGMGFWVVAAYRPHFCPIFLVGRVGFEDLYRVRGWIMLRCLSGALIRARIPLWIWVPCFWAS